MARLWIFLAFFAHLLHLSQQQDCGASSPCPIECCSSSGFCGFGPDFCGDGCLSGCERKAECNPGWSGSGWSESETCPLNVCCSEFGFCGFTDSFCGNNQVQRPSCSPGSRPVDRVIGYYEAWSERGRPCLNMAPEDIPYGLYTDIIFSFATINPQTFEISAGDAATSRMMERMRIIKLQQPDIRLWIAVGGWAFNDPGPTETTFSDMAASSEHTATFVLSLLRMMNQFGFDGVDIDWEYPVSPDRAGQPDDYENIVNLMTSLRFATWLSGKRTSIAIPASYWYLQNFDIQGLEPLVDWFNIMTYDMHGSWDIDNEWTGPWANSHTNMTEIQLALDLLWRNDISPRKVTMGMAYYSRSFTLADPACSEPGCRVVSGGTAGECSDTTGVLFHPEIQDTVRERGLTPIMHRDAAVKTVWWGDQWVSFDDVATWRLKANIARGQCISGFMVWAISQDDEDPTNARALVAALGRRRMDRPDYEIPLEPEKATVVADRLCRWSGCNEGYPSGFKTVDAEGRPEIMMDATVCKYLGNEYSRLCCPADQPQPTCRWRGHRNTGRCNGGCNDDEVEVGRHHLGCRSGHQSACCTEGPSTEAYGQCTWTECHDNPICWGDFSHLVVRSGGTVYNQGNCRGDRKRAMCCKEPPPQDFVEKCKWHDTQSRLDDTRVWDGLCDAACPVGSIPLAYESSKTCFGHRAFCCEEAPRNIIEERDDETDSWGAMQAREFDRLLRYYMEEPTCPADTLGIIKEDMYSMPMPQALARRSLPMTPALTISEPGGAGAGAVEKGDGGGVRRRQAPPCNRVNWNRLLDHIYVLFAVTDRVFDSMRNNYDDQFADSYDELLRFDELSEFFLDYPEYDQRAVIQVNLLNPLVAGNRIRNIRGLGHLLCRPATGAGASSAPPAMRVANLNGTSSLPSNRTTASATLNKRSPSSIQKHDHRSKRAIWFLGLDSTSNLNTPTIQQVLNGIQRGDLTLHYARWEGMHGRNPMAGGVREPFLELAYWIGPEPGRSTQDNSAFEVYRDWDSGGRSDRWIMIHLPFDPYAAGWPRQIDGRTHLGVRSMQVFHSQTWDSGNPSNNVDWRAQGRRARNNDDETLGPNARTGFDCTSGRLWYMGAHGEDGEVPEQLDGPEVTGLYTALRAWAIDLFYGGYVHSQGIRMILRGPGGIGPNGVHIDPNNFGDLIPPPDDSSGPREADEPYERNWVMDDNAEPDFERSPEP